MDRDLPQLDLKKIENVRELLAETTRRVRPCPFDLRAANATGYLAGMRLKTLENEKAEECSAREDSARQPLQLFSIQIDRPNSSDLNPRLAHFHGTA
jgi:hypothetical protein